MVHAIMKLFALLGMMWLAGCQASAGLTAATQAAPGVLGQVEALKTEIVVAPIAGCVGMLQAVSGQIKTLEAGTPGLAVASPSVAAPPNQVKSQPQRRARTTESQPKPYVTAFQIQEVGTLSPPVSPPAQEKSQPHLRTEQHNKSSYVTALRREWENSGRPFTGSPPAVTASN